MGRIMLFADVVFFIPFDKTFCYKVPADLEDEELVGKRILAPFGPKTLMGYVIACSKNPSMSDVDKIKEFYEVLDTEAILSPVDMVFYKWMADYYFSPLGDVLKLTIPYGSEVQSKRKIQADVNFCMRLLEEEKKKATVKYSVLASLIEKSDTTVLALQKSVKRKNIYSVLRTLTEKGAISIIEQDAKARITTKKENFVQLTAAIETVYEIIPELENRSPKQAALLLRLVQSGTAAMKVSTLASTYDIPLTSFSALAKRGMIKVFQKKIDRRKNETYQNDLSDYKLTEKQTEVYNKVLETIGKKAFKPFLLRGVTGSGKTLIYIELARKVMESGNNVLLLVPEISLTPQITSRFYSRFGDNVIVIHSKISDGERYDAWMKAISSRGCIVIGARSALFAPLRDIGLIIVDEEHDSSYKQSDSSPRYNARDSAVYKASLLKCPILLGSATPSLETMYNADSKKFELLTLDERVDGAKLPVITMVNVIEEKKHKRMLTLFSQTMIDKIRKRLDKKEGVIVLQNRRGFSTSVYCFDCGEIETCINCSVSLVHHINDNILKCHYCGYAKQVPSQCTKCGSYSIKYFGTGTERVEDELSYYIPDAKIERIDSDTLNKVGSFSKILSQFREGAIDILLGTQIVAKGLDFSRVTLVCVVSADTNLWIPDFRAEERTFQLLTQVSGRAGRSSNEGEVLIQTQNEKSRVLQKVIFGDYAGFYDTEIVLRQRHSYPPFSRLCMIEMKDMSRDKVQSAIGELHGLLLQYRNYIKISPPTTAVLERIKTYYRYQIMIKSERTIDPSGNILRKSVSEALAKFTANSKNKDIAVIIDMDPQVVL